ncbi:HEAT repeat domain-containing protein [Polyangium mundeleinium]|uniref:HEAT repeat domain-containing protein n=1 Tax=Polyangium mundeleinium TaxID=2995306 RepID=A0ABT5EU71_9BACT|nr:HEAT repeat domain-containing protein [Polyangium mundeleinium]MDC0744738.1 HEAT repeat domain-containing protein [Polyangium mundeleinium]
MISDVMRAEASVWMLETYRPPLAVLAERLASTDPAEALAAAKALAKHAREGEDDPKALAACVPADLLALTHDAQAVVAELAVTGLPIVIPKLPANLPPELACRFRCATLLASPERLPLDEASPLDLRAVADAPVERALTSGLWLRAAAHARPAMHDRAITFARAGLVCAILSPVEAAEVLLDIARRSSDAVASRALGLLAEPWAQGLSCPPLAAWLHGEEVALAALRLAASRRDTAWVRRFATCEDVARSVRRAALVALGALGEVEDVELLLVLAEEDPAGAGPEAIEAMCCLKRRGISPDEDQARRAIELALHYDALPIEALVESTSSRADALVATIDECISRGASKARAARLLAAFGTRRTLARLLEMAEQSADPILSRCAIRELGRLEERSAEPVILAKLDAEPEACLFALGRLGGATTAQRLRSLLEGTPPPWLSAGLRVLFRLDPSPTVLAAAAEHGAISAETLDALQAHGSAEQIDALAALAKAPGHPFRASAISALGRTGGPLAIDPLAALLTDGDEEIRELCKAALRTLGQRLAIPDPPLACLEGATDPGAALVAEAALRRLRLRSESVAETTLLLDAVLGCDHPHLVRVVRPLLRRENPEIRKRAIACLSAAGPACAAWLLPSLSRDVPLPVARQALLALGNAAVPGLGGTIAAWLSHPNMNLKKAAAEALARSRDSDVIPALVDVLAFHDQPGLRELAEQALRAIAGPFFRSLIVERIAATKEPRREDLLASTIARDFSPEELAALVARRPDLPKVLLLHAYAANAGSSADLDAALLRQGARLRIPRETDVAPESPLRAGLAGADAERCITELRRRIHEAPFLDKPSPDLVTSLRAAAERAGSMGARLAVPEQRVLSALLSQLDPATRKDALALLATTTDPFVSSRVIPFVDIEEEIDPRHAPLLPAVLRRSGAEAARSRSADPRPAVRAQAALVLRLAGEGTLAFTPPSERASLLQAWIDAGRENDLLAALEGRDAPPLVHVAKLVADRSGAAAAWALAQRWAAARPAERAPALVDLAFLGEIAGSALREIAQGETRGEVRQRAITELSRARRADRAFLRPLLADAHPGVREAAAEALIHAGDHDDRAYVLGTWLGGAIRGSFSMTLGEQDTPAVAKAVADATTEAEQLRVLGPVAALPPASRIPLLFALHSSPHPRVSGAARDSLRSLPAAHVLPHVEARLRAGDLSLLDIIGAAGAVPRLLADLARTSDDPAAWIRFCLRAAGGGVLYAAGLGSAIAAWASASPSPAALSLLARLADWYDERHARALCRALDPALSGAHRDAVLGALLEALREQPPELVSRVLSGIVRPTDTLALQLLAEAEARSPGLLDLLAPALRAAVERALDTALDTAGPETARRLLTYFAGRADRPSERERVLTLLERHVRSSERRVSLHAHRLLRTLAPRERYLRATRALLDDSDPTTVRLAIRVLAFGGHADSAAEIAARLFHLHAGVSRAARAGLLALGEAAVPPLLGARGHLRPDRRAAIDAVLDEIRSRLTAGKTAR